jgi:hypothetical protein
LLQRGMAHMFFSPAPDYRKDTENYMRHAALPQEHNHARVLKADVHSDLPARNYWAERKLWKSL